MKLWAERDDEARTRDELLNMLPDGINRDHWAIFVDYRLSDKAKEKSQKNREIRKKQTTPHTGGSKSLARKRAEMEIEYGRKVSRGEVWTATHKHANGEYVNDEAREIGEKIQAYEESTPSLSHDISNEDSLAYAFGKEHSGRVRGLGLGPCPSQVFGHPYRSYSGINSSFSSTKELENQVAALKSQVDQQNKKFDAMFNFFMQHFQGQVPPDLAVFHSSPASDQGSAHPTNVADSSTPNSQPEI